MVLRLACPVNQGGWRNTFPKMIAPAARSLDITKASCVGVQLTIANEPAVVGISDVSTLSFTRIGTQKRGNCFYISLRAAARLPFEIERDYQVQLHEISRAG